MKEKELNKLVRQVKKIDNGMTTKKVKSGIAICKVNGIEITPSSVYSGYMSLHL
jgi:hypothetical protein